MAAEIFKKERDELRELISTYAPVIEIVRELQSSNKDFKNAIGHDPKLVMSSTERYNAIIDRLLNIVLPQSGDK